MEEVTLRLRRCSFYPRLACSFARDPGSHESNRAASIHQFEWRQKVRAVSGLADRQWRLLGLDALDLDVIGAARQIVTGT